MKIAIQIWDRVPWVQVMRVRICVIRVHVMGIGYFAQAYQSQEVTCVRCLASQAPKLASFFWVRKNSAYSALFPPIILIR
jgi:hypothetical protein